MARGTRKRSASTTLAGTPKKGRITAVEPDTPCSTAAPDPTWFDASDPAKVLAVKAVLRACRDAHDQLPLCREREIAQLQPLLRQGLQTGHGGFIYVAGTPGIGKTLTVRAVVLAETARLGSGATGRRDAVPSPALVYINCMSLDGNSLLTRVAEGLQRNMHRTPKQAKEDPLHQPTGKVTFCKPGDAQERLQLLLQPLSATAGGIGKKRGRGSEQQALAGGLRVVILDELDGLMAAKPTVQELKQLLAIACRKDSRLLVLGVANAFTLVEEYAQDLNLTVSDMRKVLFHPYSRQQMASILRQQVQQLPGPMFEPMALSLCAAKMADNHGDVRKALSTCEAALDMLVDEAHSAAAAAGGKSSSWQRRLIGPDEVSRAAAQLSGGYGGTSETVEAIRGLPADQKLALIAAYHLAGSSSSSSCATDSGSSASAATEVFLREDSNSSISSGVPKARCTVRAAPAGTCTRISSGFRCRKPQLGGSAAGSSGRRSSVAGSMRRDCRLGPLHRHYQSLCKQMMHEHVQTLGFGDFQCMVTDLMSRVLTCRLVKNKGDSTVTLAVAGEDVMMALADSLVYKHLLNGGC